MEIAEFFLIPLWLPLIIIELFATHFISKEKEVVNEGQIK